MVMSHKNLIYKDNKIIEASYKLSLTEQRLVLLAISQVNSSKKLSENDVFVIYAKDYSSIFSISKDEAFREMKSAMKSLSSRWVKVIDDGDVKDEISWLSKRSSATSNQSIGIRFSTDISKYLCELTGEFTKYRLLNISGMKSAYSIRIYEMLMRWKSKRRLELTVEQLKDRLQLTAKSYENFGNIRQKIIDVAMTEIAECSDILPRYELIRRGNKVSLIRFEFEFKEEQAAEQLIRDESISAIKNIKKTLT